MSYKIPLPIKLYSSHRSLIFGFIISLGTIWLAYVMMTHISNEQLFTFILAILTLCIGVFLFISNIIMLFKPQPVLIITRFRIISGYPIFKAIFRPKNIAFKDIQSLELNYRVMRDSKHWYITILLKNAQKIVIPLHKFKYESMILNEKEIFNLIEQIHQGIVPPNLEGFEMGIHDRITNWGIFTIMLMVTILVLSFVMI